MVRLPKSVNAEYFNEDSKNVFYVLGISYACYSPNSENGVVFRSRHRRLIEIVKDELSSGHAIVDDPRNKNSHWIEIHNNSHLRESLEQRGLVKDKSKRRFPNISERFIDHFIRGCIDANAIIRINPRNPQIELTCINKQFISGLNSALRRYAGIERQKDKLRRRTVYDQADSKRIKDFMYRDRNFIEESGLYLSANQDALNFAPRLRTYPLTQALFKRIQQAKIGLISGKPLKGISNELGFPAYTSLCRAFKRVTGMTTSQYKQKVIHRIR